MLNGKEIATDTPEVRHMLTDVSKSNGGAMLVDAHGADLNPTKERFGWMEKTDRKLSEKIELSKGMVLLMSVGPAIATLLLSLILNAMGWAREDQSVKERQIQQSADTQRIIQAQERLEKKLDDFDSRLREQERFQDRSGGYTLRKADQE